MYFIYNPNRQKKLVHKDEYEKLLASGEWFATPFEAFLALERSKKAENTEKLEVKEKKSRKKSNEQ